MGKMKELVSAKAFNIAWERYGKEYYELTAAQQDLVWQEATQAATDYLSGLEDFIYEQEKERRLLCIGDQRTGQTQT